MQIALPLSEALTLATAAGPLPPMLLAVRADGATVEADIDAGQRWRRRRPHGPHGQGRRHRHGRRDVRVVHAGTAVFTIKAHARGLPVESLLGQAAGMIPRPRCARPACRPTSPSCATGGPHGPELVVHVQRAVDAKVSGVVVQDLTIADGTAHVTATVGDVRLG